VTPEKDTHKWRQFSSWFPHPDDDWYRDVTGELNAGLEKTLLCVLDKCKKMGYSWMSKQTLAGRVNVSKSTIFNYLNKLYELGWLKKAGFQNSVMRLEPTKKAIKHFFE
jgi:hypothetical protein